MKVLSPKLRAKHRRLLNFMLSPEFSKLSTATGQTMKAPLPKEEKTSAKGAGKPRDHEGTWCIDTPEGMLLLTATFKKRPNGKLRYRSQWSFAPASLFGPLT